MFIRTEKTLLSPLHSLLSKPFEFNASNSLKNGPFSKGRLKDRSDMAALAALCAVYDSSKMALLPYLSNLRIELETIYSVRLTLEGRFRDICQVIFRHAPTAFKYDMDPSDYLIFDHGQIQLERLYDTLQIRRMGHVRPCASDLLIRIIRFLLLNDALVFALSGLAKVEQPQPKHFSLRVFDEAALHDMRRLWFSRSISQESSVADLARIKHAADMRAVPGQELWEALIDSLLDKYFAIAYNNLTTEGRVLRTVQHLRGLVGVVAMILTRQAHHQDVTMNRSSLAECGLDYSFVSGILERLQRSLVTDVFLWREWNKLICNPGASSTVMRKYAVDLAKEFDEVQALRDHVIGDFFEKQTIIERLRTDPQFNSRYNVFEHFDRHKVLDDAVNEADVDLILFDRLLQHYYFIQVKYTLPGQIAGFANEIKQLQNDISGGLHQIREAKRLLESGQLVKTLAHRGIHDAHNGNCSFLLLHNIATYDYQITEDGIALYEWASFRNLLRDCEMSFGSTDKPLRVIKLPKPVLLSDPQHVIDALFKYHPVFQRQQENIWANEQATTTFTVENAHIRVEGLGI
jgi:hypothetical protein